MRQRPRTGVRARASRGSVSDSFHVFAFDRRDVVRRTKALDDGALATIFSCDHRWRRTFVHSDAGWLVIHEKAYGTFDPGIISKPHAFAAGDISAVEVYLYLDVVGKSAPGRVKEVGWFGHAFGGGASGKLDTQGSEL